MMEHNLDDRTIFFIEEEAKKVQENLIIDNEPNIYNYDSVKRFLESKGMRLEFNVILTDTNNSTQGSWYDAVKDTILPYNVLTIKDCKILQFDITEPTDIIDKYEYIKFLKSVFWEYWDEFKKCTVYNNVEYLYKMDYSLFSRAMIIPYEKFLNEISLMSEEDFNINHIAEIFSVGHFLIYSRLDDCD